MYINRLISIVKIFKFNSNEIIFSFPIEKKYDDFNLNYFNHIYVLNFILI